jgi:hypothetical protein
MHASPLFTGWGCTLGRFECPPDADRWRAVGWIDSGPLALDETSDGSKSGAALIALAARV